MNKKVKNLTITAIRRAAPITDPTTKQQRPGNILINGNLWFSSVEWRNNLLGAELPLEMPVTLFIGCRVQYAELTVTKDMLEAGGGQHKEIINGREVTYKKEGVNNVEMVIDFSTITVSDSAVNLTKIKQLFPTQRVNTPAAQPQRRLPAGTPAEDAEVITVSTDDQINENGLPTPPVETEATENVNQHESLEA